MSTDNQQLFICPEASHLTRFRSEIFRRFQPSHNIFSHHSLTPAVCDSADNSAGIVFVSSDSSSRSSSINSNNNAHAAVIFNVSTIPPKRLVCLSATAALFRPQRLSLASHFPSKIAQVLSNKDQAADTFISLSSRGADLGVGSFVANATDGHDGALHAVALPFMRPVEILAVGGRFPFVDAVNQRVCTWPNRQNQNCSSSGGGTKNLQQHAAAQKHLQLLNKLCVKSAQKAVVASAEVDDAYSDLCWPGFPAYNDPGQVDFWCAVSYSQDITESSEAPQGQHHQPQEGDDPELQRAKFLLPSNLLLKSFHFSSSAAPQFRAALSENIVSFKTSFTKIGLEYFQPYEQQPQQLENRSSPRSDGGGNKLSTVELLAPASAVRPIGAEDHADHYDTKPEVDAVEFKKTIIQPKKANPKKSKAAAAAATTTAVKSAPARRGRK